MAYTPTNWVTGQTPLSAANLNNIEQGISDLNSKAIPDSAFNFYNIWTILSNKSFVCGDIAFINLELYLTSSYIANHTYNPNSAMDSAYEPLGTTGPYPLNACNVDQNFNGASAAACWIDTNGQIGINFSATGKPYILISGCYRLQ